MLYFLSFATDTEHLGATVIDATNDIEAYTKACHMGLNPGGEVAILPMPEDMTNEDLAEMLSYKDRLVGKAELISNGGRRIGDEPDHIKDAFDEYATHICQEHNK